MTLTTTHIDELLEKCRLGDQRAQMKVYNKYYKAMFNTALRIVKHSAEAEDIMQEAFLTAFSKLDTFQGNSTFGAWLKKIVVNRSINAFNKNSRHQEVTYNDQLKDAEDDGIGIGEQEEETSPKVQQILKAMDSLKENYRLVLTLHLIEGYDYEEICEILGLTNANCRTTISRAKESLRKKLMSYEK
ncbi:RNA polymerase subunit sigma-24 [Salinimicrobium marinum]|uniref:RNA polymerase subunit sigma-24 n=1 Tax=Salinimicrobium marinum TaxID=680283 RepID=A0A918VX37_9FLAO|nr:RNA polymerase sigma factor [Salinimicrobium marinum]GHA33206.1 RNA polymerase subunit sigma-24 [Salinimicrobium marinum]